MAAAPALALLEQSRGSLADAYAAELATARFVAALDAAMRAAAAHVAGRPATRRGGARRARRDLWPLLAADAPQLREWAEHFALAAVRREEIETRRTHVTVREADDLLRAAETFVDVVAATLGMPGGARTAYRLAAARESG
ncbi:hypothetical protein BCF74_10460 [Knoellia remsis]|uniref:SAV-6107-like HEPN domain-containing protein n=1 Tax=Knoellia remsis TaxID=407159 RepID=A0A2T0UXK9_9MICO|nr:SAV_6107 family HEPN domain-containing protein [Knoellia remsis]PRY62624.1 hypothetical protein BCF74_10460 [Knoellia remsis]